MGTVNYWVFSTGPASGSSAKRREVGASTLPGGDVITAARITALLTKRTVPFLPISLPKRAEWWGGEVGSVEAQTPSQADRDLPKVSIHPRRALSVPLQF